MTRKTQRKKNRLYSKNPGNSQINITIISNSACVKNVKYFNMGQARAGRWFPCPDFPSRGGREPRP